MSNASDAVVPTARGERNYRILVSLNPEEREIVEAGAKADGLGLGPFLRRSALRAAKARGPLCVCGKHADGRYCRRCNHGVCPDCWSTHSNVCEVS